MNPIHYDFTLIGLMLSFWIVPIILLVICGLVIYAVVRQKQQRDQEISSKLNRVIELLEKEKDKD